METPDLNPTETKPNPLKSEHLRDPMLSIVASIGTENQHSYGSDLNKFKLYGKEVDYYALGDDKDEDHTSSDYYGYVISNIDKSMKFTERLHACTSVIAVGLDKETGENISFLTHQDPTRTRGESFKKDLERRLNSLKNKCEEGTIDIVIVGGRNIPDRMKGMSYQSSIEALDNIVDENMGFEPVVICGPKEQAGDSRYDSVYFDTKNRRLFVVRPKYTVLHNDSFVAGDLEEVNEGWKEREGE